MTRPTNTLETPFGQVRYTLFPDSVRFTQTGDFIVHGIPCKNLHLLLHYPDWVLQNYAGFSLKRITPTASQDSSLSFKARDKVENTLKEIWKSFFHPRMLLDAQLAQQDIEIQLQQDEINDLQDKLQNAKDQLSQLALHRQKLVQDIIDHDITSK